MKNSNKKIRVALILVSALALTSCGKKEEITNNIVNNEINLEQNNVNENNLVLDKNTQDAFKDDEEEAEKEDRVIERMENLKDYGIEYKKGQVYYKKKVAKNFVDIGTEANGYSDSLYLLSRDSDKDDIVVFVKRDDNGKILSIEEYTREEFENL